MAPAARAAIVAMVRGYLAGRRKGAEIRQSAIARAIHLAHTAAAGEADNLVRAEPVAG